MHETNKVSRHHAKKFRHVQLSKYDFGSVFGSALKKNHDFWFVFF